MAKNTGEGHRNGFGGRPYPGRETPRPTSVKRNRDHGSENEGEFMDVKQDGQKFKGVAEEPDKRRGD